MAIKCESCGEVYQNVHYCPISSLRTMLKQKDVLIKMRGDRIRELEAQEIKLRDELAEVRQRVLKLTGANKQDGY